MLTDHDQIKFILSFNVVIMNKSHHFGEEIPNAVVRSVMSIDLWTPISLSYKMDLRVAVLSFICLISSLAKDYSTGRRK